MNANLEKIDHIVVLMMENRSFDNIMGWLYDPRNNPPFEKVPYNQYFDGVSGKNLTNPIPTDAPGSEHLVVPLGRATFLDTPNPDPGNLYSNVNTQLFGTIIPPGNHPPFKRPYNLPSVIPSKYPMNGFVKDYISEIKYNHQSVKYEKYKQIMDCYTPGMLPVISRLALNYAVCDQWFCSVPGQTMPNRSFFNTGTSNGYVNNKPYIKWFFNTVETVFNLIEEKKDPNIKWKVYFDRMNIVPLTLITHFPRLIRYAFSNFFYMEKFYQDAAEGNLPSYAFIEPRFFFKRNDQHPPSSISQGEILIDNVYQSLRSSKNWEKTLFVVTYDEHGGCYDHVQPPVAVCPTDSCTPGEQGFKFDRLGLRVPTVLVSPYIKDGTVFRARDEMTGRVVPLDHNSVLKTLTNRFGLRSLTRRDKASADLSQVLILDKPRTDYPIINP